MSEFRFIKNYVIKGKIEVLTGLHIGGSKEKLEIGGVDSPVIRNPLTLHPYIPGSSLKGKMRMLTEFALGKIQPDKKGNCGPHKGEDKNDVIGRVFGDTSQLPKGPTRLIVRDATPDANTIKKWESANTELHLTELKPENTIDRLTSEANPRFLERVIAGSFFNFEILYSVYSIDGDEGVADDDNFNRVIEALRLVEHSGLGGSISRGYGKVKFHILPRIEVTSESYRANDDKYRKAVRSVPDNVEDLMSLDQI